MKMKRVNEVFDRWLQGKGIFYGLQSFDTPWKTSGINVNLDMEYHGNFSGDKIISPIVSKVVEDKATDENIIAFASVIFTMCNTNWTKEFQTLSLQYDPIRNYDMNEVMSDDNTTFIFGKSTTRTNNLSHTKRGTETTSPNITEQRTDNLSHAKTGTDTETFNNVQEERTDNLSHDKTGTDTETFNNVQEQKTLNLQHSKTGSEVTTPNTTKTTTPTVITQTENFVSAFNSTSYAPESKSVTTNQSGSETTTETGTETKSFNNRSDNDSGTDTNVKSGSIATGYNNTETDTGTQTNVKSGSISNGYNNTETDTGTQTTVKSGNEEIIYNTTDSDTGTVTDLDGGRNSTEHSYSIHKYGNIGFATFQKMIREERDVWAWYFFYNVVFPDIDKILTIPIY